VIVANGSTNVSTYFVLRDSTAHAPKTDVTITDIDIYYLEQGAAMVAKADLTALAAADSAWDDNTGFHCGQGLYRIDWPNAAFDGGIGKRAYLIVACSGVDTEIREVELSPPVNIDAVGEEAVGEATTIDANVVSASAAGVAAMFSTTAIAESYAADNTAGTVAQILYLIQQLLSELSYSGTTGTVKKIDGSTTAARVQINSATAPTSVTRIATS
jgi:hypothetical protein